MKISIIAAMSENRVIGSGSQIPWKIPGEQIRFKELTIGKTVIMGRKTYEAMGGPLPHRKSIIITRTLDVSNELCQSAGSLEEAIELIKDQEEVFIAGGGEIYKEVLPYADTVYLTVINKEYEGDIFFPEIKPDDFDITYTHCVEGTIPYTYFTLERKEKESPANA